MTTESNSYTRGSFAEGVLRTSVPQLEQTLCLASIERVVLVCIRSV